MNNIKKTFEKNHQNFLRKKKYFKKIIEQFQVNGKLVEYNYLKQLLNDAEIIDAQLQGNLVLITADGLTDRCDLREKLKAFKKIVKELNETTKPLWRQWTEAVVVAIVLAFIIRTVIFGLYYVPSGSAEPTILIGDRVWANKFVYFFKAPQRGEFAIFDNPEEPYDSNVIVAFWQKYIGLPIPILGIKGGPSNWVKRIIAVPGDTIEGKLEDGQTVVYLNGKKLDEPYLNPYPLIRVNKIVGFIEEEKIGPFKIPDFFRKQIYQNSGVGFSYDPTKSFEDQPFYHITEEEIVRDPLTGGFLLSYSRTPCYDLTSAGTLHCVDEFGPITIPAGMYWMMGDNRKNSHDSRWWYFLDQKQIHGRASFIVFSIDTCEYFWLFELIKHPVRFWNKNIRWSRFLKGLS